MYIPVQAENDRLTFAGDFNLATMNVKHSDKSCVKKKGKHIFKERHLYRPAEIIRCIKVFFSAGHFLDQYMDNNPY